MTWLSLVHMSPYYSNYCTYHGYDIISELRNSQSSSLFLLFPLFFLLKRIFFSPILVTTNNYRLMDSDWGDANLADRSLFFFSITSGCCADQGRYIWSAFKPPPNFEFPHLLPIVSTLSLTLLQITLFFLIPQSGRYFDAFLLIASPSKLA